MEEIIKIANEFNLYVIEDTAQALGADYIFSDGKKTKAGTNGDIGTTSFFPSKNLGCFGDGGAIFTNDEPLAVKLRSLANHGMQKRYYYEAIGMNSRLDTIQAAVLRIKLKQLDQFNVGRQQAASLYDKGLNDFGCIEIPVRNEYSSHIFNQYTIRLKKGNNLELQEYLKSYNVPSMIYYPIALHLQESYKTFNYKIGDFTVAESLCNRVISLPMHTELRPDQIEFIVEKVKSYFAFKSN
jgi:dTDP-4-amino-4,6-dideoxygalactose transaminase